MACGCPDSRQPQAHTLPTFTLLESKFTPGRVTDEKRRDKVAFGVVWPQWVGQTLGW